MKGKKKSPSKVRYDAGYPVMSFGLSLELKERLNQYVNGKGLSYADYIKETIDVREERNKSACHVIHPARNRNRARKGDRYRMILADSLLYRAVCQAFHNIKVYPSPTKPGAGHPNII